MHGKLKVEIPVSPHSYDVIIDYNFFNINTIEQGSFCIIDSNIYQLYKDTLPQERIYIFHANENNKSIESVQKIISFLMKESCNRKSKIFAIGGGITGDVAAFTASIYMRGVSFVQVPTTLLSMVDSSVGGKTGVNFNNVKNIIGTFSQPQQVIIDINFLETLNNLEFLNGLAEIIKMAFLFDDMLVKDLIECRLEIINKDKKRLFNLIERTIKLKIDVVEKDEKERNYRKLLNFGHTIGHAMEVDTDYSIKHGFAVALGMYYECLYGVKNNLIETGVLDKLCKVLELYNLLDSYQIKDIDKFRFALSKDKKNEESGVVLSLPVNIGESKIFSDIEIEKLIRVFQ
jgi:3-dehydroquinate synthase